MIADALMRNLFGYISEEVTDSEDDIEEFN